MTIPTSVKKTLQNRLQAPEPFQKQHLEIDHTIAESVEGTDHMENLQLLCGHCNRIKGDHGQEYLMTKRKG